MAYILLRRAKTEKGGGAEINLEKQSVYDKIASAWQEKNRKWIDKQLPEKIMPEKIDTNNKGMS